MKLLSKTFIFDQTPPTPSCHASTLAKIGDTVIAAWFGGTYERHPDVQIWCAYLENGIWSTPVCVSEKENVAHWNPVLFDNGEELLLFYKRGETIPDWQTMVTSSRDKGRTWSVPRRMCADDTCGRSSVLGGGTILGRGPVKNKPIRLKNGDILAPASMEKGCWRCFTDLSRDNGKTWEMGPLVPLPDDGVQIIQPSLWEDSDGIHMLMRSKNKAVYRADSADGLHFDTAYPTAVPNNNSGLDLIQSAPGHLILCCNPVDTAARTPLSLLESTDGGRTFETVLHLETEPGEYSYPAIIADGNRICGTYTWRREKIVYFEALL